MRALFFAMSLMAAGVQSAAMAQAPAYRPFGSWEEPSTRWNKELALRSDRTSAVNSDARPHLAGLRSRNVEMLEDALLRKHPKLLGNDPAKARELLLRRYRANLPQLRGIMAEAVFIDRNPEWGFVKKSNAPPA